MFIPPTWFPTFLWVNTSPDSRPRITLAYKQEVKNHNHKILLLYAIYRICMYIYRILCAWLMIMQVPVQQLTVKYRYSLGPLNQHIQSTGTQVSAARWGDQSMSGLTPCALMPTYCQVEIEWYRYSEHSITPRSCQSSGCFIVPLTGYFSWGFLVGHEILAWSFLVIQERVCLGCFHWVSIEVLLKHLHAIVD